MSPISTHFDMLLEVEEQERIGATAAVREEMRVMRVLCAYREKCEEAIAAKLSWDAQSLRVAALEAELAPFRDKRGLGGYIDDMRTERNEALAEVASLRARLKEATA